MKTILNFWAVLTLAVSGVVLFWFMNIILFGEVRYYEQNVVILIAEYLLALFMFGVSLYVAWSILFRGKKIELK
ncbi:MAG: hypothetical protein ABIH65_03650 [Nanoarchaeota archaeon]